MLVLVQDKDGASLGDHKNIRTMYVCADHVTLFSAADYAIEYALKDVRLVVYDKEF